MNFSNMTKHELIKELTKLRKIITVPETSGTPPGREKDEMELYEFIVKKMHTEEELWIKSHALGERVKELQCLYGISDLVEKPGISLSEIMQGTVELIPPGWQYPDITCARITMEDKEYTTQNFKVTPWKQSSVIKSPALRLGAVEVYYLDKKPELDEGPFLKEERKLIDAISERLGRIIERVRTGEELAKERNLLRTLIDNLPAYIYVKDIESRFIIANKAVGVVMDTTIDELIGKTDFDYYPGEIAKKFYADEQEVMRSGQAIVQREEEHRDDEGKHIYISTTKVPLTDRNGKIIGIIGFGRDITKRKEAEKESLILEKQLQQAKKMGAIGTLSAGIAHEINTPMQFIGDNARFLSEVINNLVGLSGTYRDLLKECRPGDRASPLLKKGLEAEREVDLEYLEEEIPKAITQTQEGLTHVTKIINAMKNFSRMDTEEKTSADINKAVDSTVTVSRNEWKYVADVKTDLDPALPQVPCFLSDINQVVINLIVNAAHAIADAGGGRGKAKGLITITTRRQDDDVIITVSDTGTGIPEDIRDKIFEHFFTTKGVGKGTGQGLSIAYSAIVEKHGGKLTFDTEMGKGTTFIIQLPIFTNRPADMPTERKTGK